jgi:hypothetical protein
MRVWAVHNGLEMAHWWDEMVAHGAIYRAKDHCNLLESVGTSLLRHDPLAAAEFQEMACAKSEFFARPGDHFIRRRITTPAEIQAMAAAVTGHVSYVSDGEKLQVYLRQDATPRHTDKKDVWNVMFEDTAVAWHRSDPAACDAWLQTFPENAQTAARHFISKDEASRSTPPPVKPEPIPPQQRLTELPPVPGPAEAAARKDWSDWWRSDPTAAEAFLSNAAWSDDLKFRARAKAYSSKP